MNTRHNRFLIPAVYAAAATAFFIAILTIAGELVPPFKKFLTEVHSHHWVGKGIWATAFFVVTLIFGVVVLVREKNSEEKMAYSIQWLGHSLVAVTAILFAFFIFEYIGGL